MGVLRVQLLVLYPHADGAPPGAGCVPDLLVRPGSRRLLALGPVELARETGEAAPDPAESALSAGREEGAGEPALSVRGRAQAAPGAQAPSAHGRGGLAGGQPPREDVSE